MQNALSIELSFWSLSFGISVFFSTAPVVLKNTVEYVQSEIYDLVCGCLSVTKGRLGIVYIAADNKNRCQTRNYERHRDTFAF